MSDWSEGIWDMPDFGSDVDWSQIIGNQPENGSFIGQGGTDPNGLTPDDYAQLYGQAGEGLNPDGTYNFGGQGSNPLQQLSRFLTGGNGGNGSGMGALSSLLPFLATLGGGLMSRNATQDATHQVQQSLTDANKQVTDILGGAGGLYKPYTDAGASAVAQMQAMPPSNLAANYRPIGSGKGMSLASLGKR